jgi:hypothetical protein
MKLPELACMLIAISGMFGFMITAQNVLNFQNGI